MLRSTIKRIIDFPEKKEIIITELQGDKAVIENHHKRLTALFKNETPEQVNKRLENIIFRDNAFNNVMQEVVKYFEFNINSIDVNKGIEDIKKTYPNIPYALAENIADKAVKKRLIFDTLKKEWKIGIDDEEVKKSLHDFYQATNESIRKYLDDKEEFEKIKLSLEEEKILAKLFQVFLIQFKLARKDQQNEDKVEQKIEKEVEKIDAKAEKEAKKLEKVKELPE